MMLATIGTQEHVLPAQWLLLAHDLFPTS